MKFKTPFFIGFTVISLITTIAVVYSKNHNQTLNTTSQEPAYLMEQRKNIVGLWVNEYDLKDRIEFKSNGVGSEKYDLDPPELFNYQIINTTPLCGYNTEVNELKKTSYLQITYQNNQSGTLCYDIHGLSKDILSITLVGSSPMRPNVYKKSKIVLDKSKE
jgi:hypothetical protein